MTTTTINADERYLDGKHAIVTGGGRGIGAAVADALARRGASVTVMGRTMSALELAAADLRQRHGVAALAVECDVSDGQAVARAFDSAAKEQGDAYVLVNNAGGGESAAFADTDRELWDWTLGLNLTGTYLCTSRVLPAMLAAGAGRIVNIASTAALRGYRTMTAYCAAKHGVLGLTRALALETARHGVTVNAVCPGYTDTDLAQAAVLNIANAKSVSKEEALAILLKSMPQGRLTTAAEVATAVAWLCAPESAAVTGIALPIAGGEVG
ncbi:MAG: SDR family NAD(P)-dependent oxidoreductase [Gemmatimonadaceae bacterium]